MTYQDHTKAWQRLRRSVNRRRRKGLLARVIDALDSITLWRRSCVLASEVAQLSIMNRELSQRLANAEMAERKARADLAAEQLIKQQLLDTMTAPHRRGSA